MNYAPVAFFAFNRPEHARNSLASLFRCPEMGYTKLYAFCDGPRNPSDEGAIEKTRRTIKSVAGDRAEYIMAEKNLGLARSIISGVTRVSRKHGCVIVLEDDLNVSRSFLRYMNEALRWYRGESRVFQISGYMFAIDAFRARQNGLFLPFTTSWGWATWERAWDMFEPDAKGWERLQSDRSLRHRFDLGGSCNFSEMLRKQMEGKLDSWAIRWYWSVFRQEGLVMYPPQSLVENAGLDGSGTHGWRSARLLEKNRMRAVKDEPVGKPDDVNVISEDLAAIVKFFGTQKRYRYIEGALDFFRIGKWT